MLLHAVHCAICRAIVTEQLEAALKYLRNPPADVQAFAAVPGLNPKRRPKKKWIRRH